MSKIPPELEAEMTPAVKAAFLALLDQVEQLTKQVDELSNQVKKITPRNSSVPPSTEYPHAKPKRKKLPGKKRKQGGQKGHKRHLRESLVALVGDYRGIILNCDRAKMYLDGKRLQWCWAHLKRTFQSYVSPIREAVRGLLLRGRFSGSAKLVVFCNELYDRLEHLGTFTRIEGIEPTNNTAERAQRPAVIYRKLSFGTQSASGSRYLERLLSISETCRLQNRNAYQYLIAAMEAKSKGHPAPSLLPIQTESAQAAA